MARKHHDTGPGAGAGGGAGAGDGGNLGNLGNLGLGGMFRGLGGFLDLISNLAEQAKAQANDQGEGEIRRSGELNDEKRGLKAVYGFSVRMGGGGPPVVEQFGNVKRARGGVGADAGADRGPVVEEAREPMVDVFDEDDHVLVIAELPGVEAGDISFEVKEDVLDLSAARGERKYRKEILLPAAIRAEAATSQHRNGVFEIKLPKVGR